MTEDNNITTKVMHGFAWEGVAKIIVQLLSWFSTIYVARILQPDDYGIVAISGIFIGLCMLFGGMGLSAGIVQRPNVTEEEKDGIFWISLAINSVLFVLLWLAAPYIASFYDIPILNEILPITASILILSSLSLVPQAVKVRNLDFRFTALAKMFAGFVTTITVMGMAFYGYGVWSLIISVLVGEVLLSIIFLTQLEHFPRWRFKLNSVMPILRYGFGMMASRMLFFFNGRVGVIISGIFLGEKKTGYFQFAETLANLPLQKIGEVFDDISFASLSSIQEDKEKSKILLFKFHRYLVFLSYPILIGAALVAEEIVSVFLGEKWSPMVPVLELICLMAMMSTTMQMLPRFLESQGKVRSAFNFQAVTFGLVLIAMLIGAQYGLEEMLIGALMVYPFLYVMILRSVLPLLNASIGEFFKSFSTVIFINMGMALALILFQQVVVDMQPLWALVSMVLLGVGVYAALALLFMKDDIASLRSFLSKDDQQTESV